jgi:hypothetical protein
MNNTNEVRIMPEPVNAEPPGASLDLANRTEDIESNSPPAVTHSPAAAGHPTANNVSEGNDGAEPAIALPEVTDEDQSLWPVAAPAVEDLQLDALDLAVGGKITLRFIAPVPNWSAIKATNRCPRLGSVQARIRLATTAIMAESPGRWLPLKGLQDAVAREASLPDGAPLAASFSNFYGHEGWLIAIRVTVKNIDGAITVAEIARLRGARRSPKALTPGGGTPVRFRDEALKRLNARFGL